MKNILLLGAGRSATYLITFLAEESIKNNWKVFVADAHTEHISKFNSSHLSIVKADLNDSNKRDDLIKWSDVVISLLPPSMHILAAKTCLAFGKHLLTASYCSKEMAELDAVARKKNITVITELGLDPGLDHMSAIAMVHKINKLGGNIFSFKSYCGGLVDTQSDNNPWHYKFTWNPRNVVLAGQGGTAKYLENGQLQYMPYHQLFKNTTKITIGNEGEFEMYPNRDSIAYMKQYGLENVSTFIRGTLRRPPFCKSWNALVQLGLTDDSFEIEDLSTTTYAQFLQSFLPSAHGTMAEKLTTFLGISEDNEVYKNLEWLGLFSEEKIGLVLATPAQVLQHLLAQKWKFEMNDHDMIVLYHEFVYELGGKTKKITATLVEKGESHNDTAMAKTVGLPLAIACKLIMAGSLNLPGVHIPVKSEIYEPILSELPNYGLHFEEIDS